MLGYSTQGFLKGMMFYNLDEAYLHLILFTTTILAVMDCTAIITKDYKKYRALCYINILLLTAVVVAWTGAYVFIATGVLMAVLITFLNHNKTYVFISLRTFCTAFIITTFVSHIPFIAYEFDQSGFTTTELKAVISLVAVVIRLTMTDKEFNWALRGHVRGFVIPFVPGNWLRCVHLLTVAAVMLVSIIWLWDKAREYVDNTNANKQIPRKERYKQYITSTVWCRYTYDTHGTADKFSYENPKRSFKATSIKEEESCRATDSSNILAKTVGAIAGIIVEVLSIVGAAPQYKQTIDDWVHSFTGTPRSERYNISSNIDTQEKYKKDMSTKDCKCTIDESSNNYN